MQLYKFNIQSKKAFLNECLAESNYLTVNYECVPESRIHSVCSNVDELTSWGTLRTTDFPQQPSGNGHSEDCWCKLVADNNQRIVLSVISFQLFPYDPLCTETGLYLQSDRKRSKECTFLQQGHYYISSSKNLYLNFYSKRPIVRGGFWIIYEGYYYYFKFIEIFGSIYFKKCIMFFFFEL